MQPKPPKRGILKSARPTHHTTKATTEIRVTPETTALSNTLQSELSYLENESHLSNNSCEMLWEDVRKCGKLFKL